MAKAKITKPYIDKLGPGKDRTIFDEAMPRFGVRVRTSGKRTFIVQYRNAAGQTRKVTLGDYPTHTVAAAREWATRVLRQIDTGGDPAEDRDQQRHAQPDKTIAEVIDEFVTRYLKAAGRQRRSVKEYESAFNRLVKPKIGDRGIYELRRSDIAEMFDAIEDNNGPVMADRTLAYLRKAFNWYATRDDRFSPPIVKGMARTRPRELARDRVLSDDEIREIWPLLTGTWGSFVKMLLLTAQRRSEVAAMAWDEIDDNGVWTIPAERYKTGVPNIVPLSKAALAIIEAQSPHKGCDFVFASRAGTALPASGKPKSTLDAKVAKARAVNAGKPEPTTQDELEKWALPHWQLHDLRRTAKTLMVRAGVRPDISERVLGHVIAGVEGVYDRHSYTDEKRDALECLSAEVERILNPQPAKVVHLRTKRTPRANVQPALRPFAGKR